MSIIRQLARVANRIDSASTGTFLSKGDSTGDFTLVNYTDLSGRPTTLDSAALTSIVDSAYIQLRQTSAGSGGLDSAGITALVDSNYVVARSPAASSGFAQYEYTATAGQTTFQDSDINGNVMSYTADGIFVFYNGVLIAPTTDYEASDGSSVVLTTGADSGSHVAISKWNIASAGGGSAGITWGGDRGLFLGGRTTSGNVYVNNVDYVDITSPSNATDFGDLDTTKGYMGSLSDASRILYGGGNPGTGQVTYIGYFTSSTPSNATSFGNLGTAFVSSQGFSDGTYGVFGYSAAGLQYVTVQTTGNSSVFGQLTQNRDRAGACSNSTYGYICGGSTTNVIDYVTIASPGNATDFGDLIVDSIWVNAASNTSYGVIHTGNTSNSLEYISMGGTSGSATDFGDLNYSAYSIAASSNDTTAVFGSGYSAGNTINYVTIDTPSNATDFGDLTVSVYGSCAASGSPS